jgi:hypothetical protein
VVVLYRGINIFKKHMVTSDMETTTPCEIIQPVEQCQLDDLTTSVVEDPAECAQTEYITNRHIVCIPKVSNKITKQYIFGIFCALKVGYIEKLTEVPIKNDPAHKRIFVKIKWNQSAMSKYIYQRFENGENVKVVYSDPWYWICVSNLANTRALPYPTSHTRRDM